MTQSVRLETAIGDLVHTAELFQFTDPPDVLIWGERVFQLNEPGVYRECFFHILD